MHACAGSQVHHVSAMYERVPAHQMARAAQVVAIVLRQRGIRDVAVRHGPRLAGRLLRQGEMSRCGWSYVLVDAMTAVLEASLNAPWLGRGRDEMAMRGGVLHRRLSREAAAVAKSAGSRLWRHRSLRTRRYISNPVLFGGRHLLKRGRMLRLFPCPIRLDRHALGIRSRSASRRRR